MDELIIEYIKRTYKVRKIKLDSQKKFTRCLELRTGEFYRLNRKDKRHTDNLVLSDLVAIFGISRTEAEKYFDHLRY